MPWFVLFEIRRIGSIGVFERKGLSVLADSAESALSQARESLNKQGFEVRFPIDIYQYSENV